MNINMIEWVYGTASPELYLAQASDCLQGPAPPILPSVFPLHHVSLTDVTRFDDFFSTALRRGKCGRSAGKLVFQKHRYLSLNRR